MTYQVLIILIFAFLLGCMNNDPVTMGDSYNLSAKELASHQKKALSGDSESLNKLINYYQYWLFKPEKVAYWYEVDATFGNIDSKYKAGLMYSLGEYGYMTTKDSCLKGLVLLDECQLVSYKKSKQKYIEAHQRCSELQQKQQSEK